MRLGPELYTDFNAASPDVATFGGEEITNGGFDTDTAWTKGTGWSISGGVASCDGSQSANSDLVESTPTYRTSGVAYIFPIEISNYSAGVLRFYFDGTGPKALSANGLYTFAEVANNSGKVYIRADADFVGDVDNVSVKQITSSSGETNTTNGWTPYGLDVGANVFESQSSVKSTGSYALHADANDTPTADARAAIDLSTKCTANSWYRIAKDIRHDGTGGDWALVTSASSDLSTPTVLQTLASTDTTFDSTPHIFQYSASKRYLGIREYSGTNDGGVYLDNLSIKEVIQDTSKLAINISLSL